MGAARAHPVATVNRQPRLPTREHCTSFSHRRRSGRYPPGVSSVLTRHAATATKQPASSLPCLDSFGPLNHSTYPIHYRAPCSSAAVLPGAQPTAAQRFFFACPVFAVARRPRRCQTFALSFFRPSLLSLRWRRSQGGSSSPFRHRSAVLTADGGRPDGPAGQAGSAACPGWPWGSLLGHCVSFEHGFLADGRGSSAGNQYQSSERLICEPPSTVGIDYDQIHHSLAGVELFSTISRVQRA